MARQPFNTRWAQGVESEDNLNSFKDPGEVRVTTGWEGGQDKDAPPAGQENWWHNRVDTALQGVERSGVMAWHPQAQYKIGAPTMATDGNYYESLAFPNVGNNPVSTSGFWRFIGSSFFSNYDPGDIKTVAHNNTPSPGWLKCNGAAVEKASYPRLFSVIGATWNTGGETPSQFRLPDFRGEFLRGFNDGRGTDPNRVFGSYQQGTTHAYAEGPGDNGAVGSRWSDALHFYDLQTKEESAFYNPDSYASGPIYPAGTTYQIVPNSVILTTFKSRPRNKTVNYWIRY